jgi:hypothetical protein
MTAWQERREAGIDGDGDGDGTANSIRSQGSIGIDQEIRAG